MKELKWKWLRERDVLYANTLGPHLHK
uniref:Uncharacterized protein n=1 Tax=Arundo donax TaxID=35708 RepID=A0A0A9B564_ARUDO